MAAAKGKKPGKEGVERLIKMSPLAESLGPSEVPLPTVTAANLEGLSVMVPAPDDLTADDLSRRFHQKVRAAGHQRPRAADEALGAGDEVELDVLGYVDGKLLPFSARFGWWAELSPMPALPGLMEGVATGHVGESLELRLTLPADYPVPAWRGAPVRFAVDVLAAREVTPLDPDTSGFFAALGLGNSLDAVMNAIREELEEELSDELLVLGRELVLDEVARRTKLELPVALVDEEIKRRWASAEGQGLIAHEFTAEEQLEARAAWLADPATRAECERRLRISLSLRAVAEAEKAEPSPEDLKALLVAYAEPWGLSASEVDAALHESKKTARALGQLGFHLWVVDRVVSGATITFEGA